MTQGYDALFLQALKYYLPLDSWLSLACSGPHFLLYREEATNAESGIFPSFIPRGEVHSDFGISNPVVVENVLN